MTVLESSIAAFVSGKNAKPFFVFYSPDLVWLWLD